MGLGNFYEFSFTKCKPVKLSNTGKVQYREYIPFNTEGFEIVCYAESESTLRISVGDEEKAVKLSKGENKLAASFDNKIFKGEKKLL